MAPSDIFTLGLGLAAPWRVVGQRLETDKQPNELHLAVAADPGARSLVAHTSVVRASSDARRRSASPPRSPTSAPTTASAHAPRPIASRRVDIPQPGLALVRVALRIPDDPVRSEHLIVLGDHHLERLGDRQFLRRLEDVAASLPLRG